MITVTNDQVLNQFIKDSIDRCIPITPGQKKDPHDLPINDRIGALILTRVAYHLSDPDDIELHSMIAIFYTMLGMTTELRAPVKSSMELLNQMN